MRGTLQIVFTALGLSSLFDVSNDAAHHVDTAEHGERPWLNSSYSNRQRVEFLFGNMSMPEKMAMVEGAAGLENHGVGAAINPCIGLVKISKRLGIPDLCMGDGPSGVSNGLGNVTTFPAPIVVSSSWDTDLMYEYAKAIAREHRDKGHNVALTPTINIQRTPLRGRNAESFAEDPFLTSEMAVASVKGTQSEGILASVKHFAAYNQETNRFGDSPSWSAADAIVSNRTLHEVYFPAFKAVVERADPGSVMTSYNKVNGIHASENPALLQTLHSWGFTDGFTVTDWYFGHRSTVAAALAGQTMSMPGGKSDFGFEDFYSRRNLMTAIDNGSLPLHVFNDMVRRVLTPIFRHGLVDNPRLGHVNADVRRKEHHELCVRAVEEGTIMLKNRDRALPLGSDTQQIAVIGFGGDYGALVSERYGGFVGSPNLNDTLITPLRGLRTRAGPNVSVTYAQGHKGLGEYDPLPSNMFSTEQGSGVQTIIFNSSDWTGSPVFDKSISNTTAAFSLDLNLMLSPWPSARYRAIWTPEETGVHSFTLYAGGYVNLRMNGRRVVWLRKQDFVDYATGQIHLNAGERVEFELDYSATPAITSLGLSLTYSSPSTSGKLLDEAISTAKEADVSIVFVGNILSEGGDGTSLQLPGTQDELVEKVAGASKKTVVVGQTNNPFLMPWLSEVDAVLLQWYAGEGVGTALANIIFGDVNPSGRLAMTFPPADDVGPTALPRRFPGEEADDIYGASEVYYDEGLLVGYRWYDEYGIKPLFPFGHGLTYSTFELSDGSVSKTPEGASVRVHLTNTGNIQGKEVVQLYVGYPSSADEPQKVLKSFRKVSLDAGESTLVELFVGRDQLRYWSEETGQWVTAPGRYAFHVGQSSSSIAYTGYLSWGC